MRDVLRQLGEALAAQRPLAVCRVVETRGSTPQKAGATMLVLPDGSQAGTLGGGCVEAEVKRRALAILTEGDAEVATFQLDNDYGWDDGLICGGRMKILIDPLRGEAEHEYYTQLAQHARSGEGAVELIAFDADKSGLAAPSCYLFDEQRSLLVSIPTTQEGQAPDIIEDYLPDLNDRPRPSAAHGVAVLPLLSRCRLVIVGGGHVGCQVGAMAVDLDFDVWAIDDREEYVSPERFRRAERRIAGSIERVLPELEITPNTYCLIVTRGHQHDERALYHLAERGARYVGLIGSKRKIKMIFDDLLAEGISPEALERVFAPVGIDIGSQTVPEIAISILAELVAHRNLGGHVPGRMPAIAVGHAPQ